MTLTSLRTRHGAATPIGRRASTLIEVTKIKPVDERHRERQRTIAQRQAEELGELVAKKIAGVQALRVDLRNSKQAEKV